MLTCRETTEDAPSVGTIRLLHEYYTKAPHGLVSRATHNAIGYTTTTRSGSYQTGHDW